LGGDHHALADAAAAGGLLLLGGERRGRRPVGRLRALLGAVGTALGRLAATGLGALGGTLLRGALRARLPGVAGAGALAALLRRELLLGLGLALCLGCVRGLGRG